MSRTNGKHLPWEPVTLTWGAQEFVIPPNRIMGAISRMEDAITFTELAQAGERNAYPLGKIAQAYGNLLRYAGCTVTDLEVYSALFGRRGDQPDQIAAAGTALNMVTTLMTLMLPPDLRHRVTDPAETNERPLAGGPDRHPSGDGG